MTRCEFLVNEISLSCTNCTGWFCTAKGRKKKVGDTTICNNDEQWSICTRFVDVYPEQEPLPPAVPKTVEEIIETEDVTYFDLLDAEPIEDKVIEKLPPPLIRRSTPRAICPYYAAPPPGMVTCCGKFCYAENESLRTGTQCTSRPTWIECVRRVRAVKRGVPHANS